MKVSPIDANSNFCMFQVELTWEQAKALYELAPALLASLGTALRDRIEDGARRKREADEIEKAAQEQKAEWAKLADECEAEIRRRSNSPGSRQVLIKQLAAERGVSTQYLSRILRVQRREAHQALVSHRIGQIKRLEAKGQTQRQIAEIIGLTERQVRNYLALIRRGGQ